MGWELLAVCLEARVQSAAAAGVAAPGSAASSSATRPRNPPPYLPPRYAEPFHGVVLFRHHDPLAFDPDQLGDLLDASWLWFERCAAAHRNSRRQQDAAAATAEAAGQREQRGGPGGGSSGVTEEEEEAEGDGAPLWPFFLWNCLPRAGASQFHGHAQVGGWRAVRGADGGSSDLR
jgi:hypothetical protein